MSAGLNLIGLRYGRLIVLERVANFPSKKRRWRCRCECGSETIVVGSALKNGNTGSCGCLRAELTGERTRARNTTHGLAGTGAHSSWEAMHKRCYNSAASGYQNYGGRGIKVCDRWHDFANFYEDMGDRPDGLSLDRYPDVDGHYEPGNCRWATPSQQHENVRPRQRSSSGRYSGGVIAPSDG